MSHHPAIILGVWISGRMSGKDALSQLWPFIVAPFIGAALSALVWKALGREK